MERVIFCVVAVMGLFFVASSNNSGSSRRQVQNFRMPLYAVKVEDEALEAVRKYGKLNALRDGKRIF